MKDYKRIAVLFLYLLITIGVTYLAPRTVSSTWYIILLVLYYRSSDEVFWLAFFMTVSDGFLGFFSTYSTVITLIPGLPGIDMPQFYILISLYKIFKRKTKLITYYGNWTKLLMVYICFLVLVGVLNGITGELNVYFRIVKLVMPLFLIFTVPRIITDINELKKLFDFLFIIFITGFASQIFNVFTGFSPAKNFKLPESVEGQEEVRENLRSFYNVGITLMSLLASLFFLSIKKDKYFPKVYLYLIIGMAFFMAFLSASRGWIISFGIIITLFFIIVERGKNIGRIAILFLLLITVGMTSKKIRDQTFYAMERFMTLEALANGDLSADGTLSRLNERGPIVMEAWAQNPIFGWGYSNVYFVKNDGHVGNQNILLLSGVVGFLLIMTFLLFINITILLMNRNFSDSSQYKNTPLVLVTFFLGYFMIHSSSGQQIGFSGYPINIFPQGLFLAISCIMYNLCKQERVKRKQVTNSLTYNEPQ